jgi:hypothetical protein
MSRVGGHNLAQPNDTVKTWQDFLLEFYALTIFMCLAPFSNFLQAGEADNH